MDVSPDSTLWETLALRIGLYAEDSAAEDSCLQQVLWDEQGALGGGRGVRFGWPEQPRKRWEVRRCLTCGQCS